MCGECYEVPADMQKDVEKHLPGSASKSRKGTPALDLRAGLWNQLGSAGVGKIGVDPRCTFEEKDLFSHRRQSAHRAAGVGHLDRAVNREEELAENLAEVEERIAQGRVKPPGGRADEVMLLAVTKTWPGQ